MEENPAQAIWTAAMGARSGLSPTAIKRTVILGFDPSIIQLLASLISTPGLIEMNITANVDGLEIAGRLAPCTSSAARDQVCGLMHLSFLGGPVESPTTCSLH